MVPNKIAMRDALMERLAVEMKVNKSIFFVAGDFGAPKLDFIRSQYPDRFINVGIAEQNLINVATGLALEGFTVFAYALAPFISMRAFEQIRTNISLHTKFKSLNIIMVGVGAGISYDVSGPTHHCLEDICLMRMLPSINLISPSDGVLTDQLFEYCIHVPGPKYLRFDSKPVDSIYHDQQVVLENGFHQFSHGKSICIVSTGFMTHVALEAMKDLSGQGVQVGVVDVFLLKNLNRLALYENIKKYSMIVTVEEGFIKSGGLDALVRDVIDEHNNSKSTYNLHALGMTEYLFEQGGRAHLHTLCGLDKNSIKALILKNIIESQM